MKHRGMMNIVRMAISVHRSTVCTEGCRLLKSSTIILLRLMKSILLSMLGDAMMVLVIHPIGSIVGIVLIAHLKRCVQVSLGRGRSKPLLGRCRIEGRAESGCELIAESRLCSRIAALRGDAVPMRRPLRIRANRQSLGKEAIEQGAGFLRRIDV